MLKQLYLKYKSSLIFATSTFITQAINVITLPIFTRLLSQADYGILSASNSVQNLSSSLFRLGTHQSVLKQYLEYTDKERANYFYSVLVFSFTFSLVAILVIIAVTSVFSFSWFEGVEFFPYLLVPLFTSGFSVSYAVFQSQLRVLNLSRKYIVLSVVYVLSSVILSIILIKIFDMGALGKLIGNFAPFVFIFLFILIKSKASLKMRYWLDAIKFGTPLSLSSITGSLFMIYTIAFLSHQVSLMELGTYHIGRNLGLLIPQFLFQAITLTYVPFIYKKLREEKIDEITKVNTFIILSFALIITVSVFLAKIIVLILTTKEYVPAVPLIQVFFVGFILKVIYYFPMISLLHNNKSKYVSVIEIGSSIVFLACIHVFISIYGILGVAISFFIQDVLRMVAYLLTSSLKLKQVFKIKVLF